MKIRNPETGQTIEVDINEDQLDSLNESQLDSMFEAQPIIEENEAHNKDVKSSLKTTETLFPRTTSYLKNNRMEGVLNRVFRGVSALGMDLSSGALVAPTALGRSLDSKMGFGDGEQSYLESYSQLSKGQNAYGEENILSNIVGDPATIPSTLTGAALGGWVLKGGKWLPRVASKQIGQVATKATETLGRMAGSGLVEGGVSAGTHQMENLLQGKDVDLKQAGTEVGVSALAPAVLTAPAKILNKSLGVLASQLSNVSEEALRTWGTGLGKGAKSLKAVQGKQRQIGKDLLTALDDFDTYIPEKPLIDEALVKMGDIPMGRTIEAVEKAIKEFPNPNVNKTSIAKLNDLLMDVKGKGEKLTADEFKKFRGQIDDIVEWGSTGAKTLDGSLKGIRTSMKDELIQVAENTGVPEYKQLMETWSDKLQKRSALLEQIGTNAKTRDNRIGTFMSTLFNENKDVKREALENMTDIFGKDFVEQAKLVQMSGEVMQKGSQFAKILPNWTTGKATTAMTPALASGAAYAYLSDPRALAAAILLGAQSSPMLASKTTTISDLVEYLAGKSSLPTRKLVEKKEEK